MLATVAAALGTESESIDLAAVLASALHPTDRDALNWLGRCEPGVADRELIACVARDMPVVPVEMRAYLTEKGLNAAQVARRAFTIVDIVDHLVGSRANPEAPPTNPPWSLLYKRLLETGRYNSNAAGAVIPARLPHAVSRSNIGRRLCFTKSVEPYRLRYRRISGLAPRNGTDLRLAAIPAPHRADAAAHTPYGPSTPQHYELCHHYTEEERLSLVSALDEIEGSGVDVGLLPETSVDGPLADRLRERFATLSRSGFGDGLQLLMVGRTGASMSPGFNSVTVLKRGGTVAWTQAKVNGFEFTNAIIRRDRLALPLLPDEAACYHERLDIPPHPIVTVADTPYGRFMIAVCEDVSHFEPSVKTAVEAGVTHLFVPLLSRGLSIDQTWYVDRARWLSRESGCVSIIFTSAFLERRCRQFETPPRRQDEPVTVLLVQNQPPESRPTLGDWDPEGALWVGACCPIRPAT